jgi:hypothetical protein
MSIGQRERVKLPPKGWRKAIPASIRRLVKIRDGFAADEKGIHIDHRPPLHEREWDAVAQDTIPSANNALFLFAIRSDVHGKLTVDDVKRMAKTRRIRAAEDRHADALAQPRAGRERKPGAIKGCGFDKTRTRGFDGKVRPRKTR